MGGIAMRTKDPEERKKEIIQKARELFEENGINKTKVSDIVKSLGVAQGLFYYYFPSKKAIIIAVGEQIIRETEAAADRVVNSSKLNFYQKLIQYIDLYFDIAGRFIENQGLNLYLSLKEYGLEKEAEEKIIARIYQLVQIGEKENVWKIQYPEEMMQVIMGGAKELFMRTSINRKKMLLFLEQGLHFPAGSLTQKTD